MPSPESYLAFNVPCPCGASFTGIRAPTPQVPTCTRCGRLAFIYPESISVYAPPAVLEVAPARLQRFRVWRAPLAVGMIAGLAVIGVVATILTRAPARTTRPTDSPAPHAPNKLNLTESLESARRLLQDGSYFQAAQVLEQAQESLNKSPKSVDPENILRVRRLQAQTRLLRDLLAEPVGDIAQLAMNREAAEWDALFAARYHGRSVLLDTRVSRVGSDRYLVDYLMDGKGGIGEWDCDRLQLLKDLPLQQPLRLLFGFRLKTIQRLSPERWKVIPLPESGVLITDPIVLHGLSITPDEELTQVLKRQESWEPHDPRP